MDIADLMKALKFRQGEDDESLIEIVCVRELFSLSRRRALSEGPAPSRRSILRHPLIVEACAAMRNHFGGHPMNSGRETICGKVSAAILQKADRLFCNDDTGVWIELLQNARRAGATGVNITIEEAEADAGPCLVTVQDDGGGIDDFQSLLTLGASEWDGETEAREDPAGMGFFSLCRSEVEVHSGTRRVKISPSVFLGKTEATVERALPLVRGTQIRFTRSSTRNALTAALERVTEFYPLEVRLNGRLLARHDFLDGALYRELIDGIEVGFATAFEWQWNDSSEGDWNFYGARIRFPVASIAGVIRKPEERPLSLYVRCNVLETAHVKLQLPDRRAIIKDDFLKGFVRKARAAAYRFFRKQPSHALPFRNWREAKELGVELPEAAYLLSTWHASPQDENVEPLFGERKQRLLPEVSDVLLAEYDLPHSYTLGAALQSGATRLGALYEAKPEYAGYSWYDSLPRIAAVDVLVDDTPYDDWARTAQRPSKIEIEVTIAQTGQAERKVRLPASIHAPSNVPNQVDFVAVRNSPWDNDNLAGPFSVIDFLIGATFCACDDYSECDSWQTQLDHYQREIERVVNSYFRGPKASLLAILRGTIDWDANRLAEEVNVKEIHFKRPSSGGANWQIDLVI